MISLQKLPFNKKTLFSVLFMILFFSFLSVYEPESLFNIVKKYVFASYQNIEFENPGRIFFSTIVFYFLTFLYSKKIGDINRFSLFIILYHLFGIFKSWTQSSHFHVIYLAILTLLFFNFANNQLQNKKINITNYLNYFVILVFVFIKSPPFTSGWAPSEWFKVSRGYFGLFAGREINSAFMTPNSIRTFFYDLTTGGIVNLFGLEAGYVLIKSFSIFIVSYAIYRIFISLNLNLIQQIFVISMFVINQDLIGGNEIIGIFEEDRFAVSFSIIALSHWYENNFKKFSLYSVLSIFTHIQIGLFWFGFVSIFELINKNKKYLRFFRIVTIVSLPVLIPTGYEFLFGSNEIVYAFNKPSSWVYAFIFQAFHVAPFEVDGIIFNDFLIRNWANGFTNIFVFACISFYLARVEKSKKLNYFLIFFIIYFPSSIILHYLDSKLSNPGNLASLFLFRHDTVFYLIILCILIKNLKDNLAISKVIIFSSLVLFCLINIHLSQATKYNTIDAQVQKTEKILKELNPEFILIEPSKELYTGGIELRTGIPTYVSQKYITNSLSNFPEWYEKLELRGRFFQGECSLFFETNLEYFIGRENNLTKCGELFFPNGDYSIFKVPEQVGFNLPAFNSSCEFTINEAENILIEERKINNLSFEIKIIYEDSSLNCTGKVIGTNLPQGAFINKDVEEIVLVADK